MNGSLQRTPPNFMVESCHNSKVIYMFNPLKKHDCGFYWCTR